MSSTFDPITGLTLIRCDAKRCDRYVIGDPEEPTIHRAIVAGGWKPKGLRAQVHYCGEHAHLLKGAAA